MGGILSACKQNFTNLSPMIHTLLVRVQFHGHISGRVMRRPTASRSAQTDSPSSRARMTTRFPSSIASEACSGDWSTRRSTGSTWRDLRMPRTPAFTPARKWTMISGRYSIFPSGHNVKESIRPFCRYLSLHDNKFLRYFKGHTKRVISLEMSPADDTFMSGSVDNTVRLWDLRSPTCSGIMHVQASQAVMGLSRGENVNSQFLIWTTTSIYAALHEIVWSELSQAACVSLLSCNYVFDYRTVFDCSRLAGNGFMA